ncbi:MAG: metal ABC transporter ATP-binding protein [Actinomycetota bacterium]|nr:metal ABC transporter ATP-binding protein [Actinomycetota bacterium]
MQVADSPASWPSSGSRPRSEATPLVRLLGASVGYDQRPVLQVPSLELLPGDAVAVLGSNGAGKSTLIRGILGLADVLDGTVELFGQPRAHFRAWHRLGYVPQSHTVVSGIPSTVAEVVSSGRLARKRFGRRFNATDRSAIRSAITTVRLSNRAADSVSTLSGGQQRRVLIARALAGEPDILVLDEPTAGLDADSREVLAETLTGLVAAGTTLLLVTHELGEMRPLITRTVVVERGRIAYDGVPLPLRSPGDGGHVPHGVAAGHDAVDADCEHQDPHGAHPGRPGMRWSITTQKR